MNKEFFTEMEKKALIGPEWLRKGFSLARKHPYGVAGGLIGLLALKNLTSPVYTYFNEKEKKSLSRKGNSLLGNIASNQNMSTQMLLKSMQEELNRPKPNTYNELITY